MLSFLLRSLFFILFSTTVFAQSVIIDTDAGIDDLMAMLYLFNKNDLDIKGITVVCGGRTDCEIGAKNVNYLVAMAKKNIPIAIGQKQKFNEDPSVSVVIPNHEVPASIVNDSNDILGLMNSLKKFGGNNLVTESAVNLLTEKLQSSEKSSVDIIALGPLTNLAQFAHDHPELKDKIHRVYVPGNSLNAPANLSGLGNLNWKMLLDPEAANALFHSGLALYLIPLESTKDVPITPEFFDMIDNDTAHLTDTGGFFKLLINTLEDRIVSGTRYFEAPLVAVAATDANAISANFKKENIVIEKPTGALTLATEGKGADVMIFEKWKNSAINRQAFETLLWKTINSDPNKQISEVAARLLLLPTYVGQDPAPATISTSSSDQNKEDGGKRRLTVGEMIAIEISPFVISAVYYILCWIARV